ncbi:hypothetical protein NIES970_10540 [[Synechococcus] sp. NIES-970]|nr:hypothetical protein NIES970_10540 [[Synechococcus] sp. NIES-970]
MNTSSETTVGKWLTFGGLGILVIFMFLPPSYYLMAAFPWILLWQGGFLLLGIGLMVLLRQFARPFLPLGYGLDWGVLAVAIACILSAIFAPHKGVALFNLVTVSGYGVALYGLRNFSGQGFWTWDNQWRGLVGIGFGIGLVSLGGWLLGNHSLDRNSIPFGHHNFMAAYFCLVVPIILSFALAQQHKIRLLLLTLLVGIFPYLLYSCSSRGGFVGILLWAIATIAFVIGRTKGKRRITSGAIALFFLGIMVTAGLQHPRVQQLLQVNFNNGLPNIQVTVDGETEDRLFMWQAGLNILKDRPLTGIGLGNMSREYNRYRPLEVGSGAAHIQQLHSNPMQLLGELGLIGGLAIAFLVVQLVRLGWRVHQQTSDPAVRRLLYGLGGGWFAYAMATLTDYQLENIPISLTLALSVILLITVADQGLCEAQPEPLAMGQRRLWSIGSLAGILGALLVGAPYSVGMYLFARGQALWAQGQPEEAFTKVTQAYGLNDWNVNYPLRLGLWLWETRSLAGDRPADKQRTTELAAAYFLETQARIPYDYYANVNAGIVLLDLDPSLAQGYFERAVQMLSRESEPTYFLLGQTYLQTNEPEKAITSFALQGLVDPTVMTFGQWEREPLAAIRIEAVEASLVLYQTLIDRLDPQDPYILTLQERMAWLAWWHGLPIPHQNNLSQFSPMVQALILGDRQPEQALEIIDQQIATNPDNNTRWLILKAWFQVDFELNLNVQLANETEPQSYLLSSRRAEGMTLQTWLKQIPQIARPIGSDRLASRLLYRSEDFDAVDTVLRPEGLETFQLLTLLGLERGYPRTFPTLDQLINEVRTNTLDLPHPTANGFQLTER